MGLLGGGGGAGKYGVKRKGGEGGRQLRVICEPRNGEGKNKSRRCSTKHEVECLQRDTIAADVNISLI